MNTIPPRRLRAIADPITGGTNTLGPLELERHEKILQAAAAIFAEFGTSGITFAAMAIALRLSAGTLRRHFADLDELLAELLNRHLVALLRAINSVTDQTEAAPSLRRKAYLEATRRPLGGHTLHHALLLRHLPDLPPDLRDPLENARLALAEALGGATPAQTLATLDTPHLTPALAEAAIAGLATSGRAASQPPRPQAAPPAQAAPPPPAVPARQTATAPAAPPAAHQAAHHPAPNPAHPPAPPASPRQPPLIVPAHMKAGGPRPPAQQDTAADLTLAIPKRLESLRRTLTYLASDPGFLPAGAAGVAGDCAGASRSESRVPSTPAFASDTA